MTFQLDTTGFVDMRSRPVVRRWSDLDAFTQGYVEAMFVSICPEEDGSREMRTPRFDDLAPETLARIVEDCARYRAIVGGTWVGGPSAGRDLWAERQVGNFPLYPPLTAYLGDDGKVYLKEAK